MRRVSPLLALLASLFALSCALEVDDPSADLAGGKADGIFDQSAGDVTVLRASALEPIGGQGHPGFERSECSTVDGTTMDCTSAFEKRFGIPAIHPILVPNASTFFCRALRIETASVRDAADVADGIGFYYRGWVEGQFNFIESDRLVEVGEATLKNGEQAVIHEFGGLANCWLGSGTSSNQTNYEFKPYMQFTADLTGDQYRNWDLADNYIISLSIDRFDRSDEILQ